MALQLDYPDPTGVDDIQVYARVVEINLNFADEVGRITVNIYRNKASRDAGKPPIDQVAFALSKTGTPEVPELKDDNDEITQHGRPGIPPFAELITKAKSSNRGGVLIFDAAKAMVYDFLKTQLQFQGAADV